MRMGGGGDRIRTGKVSPTSALPEATDMLGKRASLLGPLWLFQCIHNPCAVDI